MYNGENFFFDQVTVQGLLLKAIKEATLRADRLQKIFDRLCYAAI